MKSHDELKVELRAWQMRQVRTLIGVGLTVGIIAAAVTVLSQAELMSLWAWVAAGCLLLAVIAAFLIMGLRGQPSDAEARRMVSAAMDETENGYSRLIRFTPGLMVLLGGVMTSQTLALLYQPDPDVMFLRIAVVVLTGALSVFMLLLVLGIGYGRWAKPMIHAELYRDLRAKAVPTGLITSVAGISGALVLGFFESRLTVAVLPAVLAGSIAALSLHLAILDRAAGR